MRPHFATLLASATALCLPGHAQEEVHSPNPHTGQDLMGEHQGDNVLDALPDGGLEAFDQILLFDQLEDGQVWARGASYKASFDETGFAYIPFLGSDAPQNYPVQFDLDEVRIDGTAMELHGRQTAVIEDQVVRQDRNGISEVYYLTESQVEQTFVFDSLPQAGELVLHMDVQSELQVRPDGGGWVFENELGSVSYGRAQAYDAAGNTLLLEQRWADDGIEIIVPADFVAQAQMPLVVDPVLSTFNVLSDSLSQVEVDVAYDPLNDLYMIVYETFFSIFDHDVNSVFYDRSLGILTSAAAIDISSARWSSPRVANNYQDATFLCVASIGSVLGSRQVQARTRSASTGITGSVVTIAAGFSDDSLPDVGGFGNDTLTSFDFVVVWQRQNISLTESEILSQGVSSAGSLIGPVVNVASIAGQRDQNPKISQSSGPTTLLAGEHQYMVVWEREESSTNRDIWVRVLDFDNDLTGHPRYRAYSFSDAIDPDVSMQAQNTALATEPYYVIVFERLVGSDYDIFAVVADNTDADNARSITAMQDLDIQDEQSDPRIAYEGGDYLIVHTSEATPGNPDAYFTALNVVSDGTELRTGLAERRPPLRDMDGSVRHLAITSTWSGGSTGVPLQGLACWVANGNFGTDGDVGAAIVSENLAGTPGSQYCEANNNSSGTSAWITARGGGQSSTGLFFLNCTDLPTNQFGLFITSMGNTVTSNPGGSAGNLCLSGAIGRYSAQVASSGATGSLDLTINPAALAQPTGTVSALSGQTWYFQCWTRDFLFGAPTSNFSNAIGVTFL